MNKQQLKNQITATLARYYSVSPEEANAEQIYSALAMCVRDVLAKKNSDFSKKVKETKSKRVYYICMEFLMGRQLKMNLCNLGLESSYREVLSEIGFDLDEIYDLETDPALGNGGLGRLAACFMDALATQQYPAKGFSILFEYGLFRQKMAEGEQLELPDIWLPSGQVWLVPRQDKSVSVKLGGKIKEKWDNGRCEPIYEDYDEIDAVPYDMFVSGADSECCNTLRLWKAQDKRNFNMEAFSQGQYIKAVEENTMAETISKVLYPADNHHEGKLLRLSQQYFLVSASLQNIVSNHVSQYKTLDNFAEKVSIHINDTHPALCVPELMRILMDDHHYSWEKAWEITVNTISYTNHTVLPEALECWNEDLFRFKLPRIHNIVTEINRRFCADAWNNFPGNWDKISRMAILGNGQVRMANLSVVGSN
ncbi:MAG: glycogen/starch/alpha-glucan phosphorylase, partial [Clostridia bacterium]|nr:glycogen/starch/alpha-glucan phosphorylase [Clostridia bacterium]